MNIRRDARSTVLSDQIQGLTSCALASTSRSRRITIPDIVMFSVLFPQEMRLRRKQRIVPVRLSSAAANIAALAPPVFGTAKLIP